MRRCELCYLEPLEGSRWCGLHQPEPASLSATVLLDAEPDADGNVTVSARLLRQALLSDCRDEMAEVRPSLDVERLAVAINSAQIMGSEWWGRDLTPAAEKVARAYAATPQPCPYPHQFSPDGKGLCPIHQLCAAPVGTYDGVEGGRPWCVRPCPHYAATPQPADLPTWAIYGAERMWAERNHYLRGCSCAMRGYCVPHGWAGTVEPDDHEICADHDHVAPDNSDLADKPATPQPAEEEGR